MDGRRFRPPCGAFGLVAAADTTGLTKRRFRLKVGLLQARSGPFSVTISDASGARSQMLPDLEAGWNLLSKRPEARGSPLQLVLTEDAALQMKNRQTCFPGRTTPEGLTQIIYFK